MANILSTTVNGQLNTGNLIHLGYTVDGSISTTAFRGINFHSASDLNYYIGKPAGAWTQPLDICFYTGIRLKSHGAYGGTTFINLSSGNTLMTVGNNNDYVKITEMLQVGSTMNLNYDQLWTSSGSLHLQYSGAGNIDMNYGGGYTFSRTSLRAPIFYDYDDTNYYLDPNGNSYLSTLRVADTVNGVALHVGSGSTEGIYTTDSTRNYLVVSAGYYPHMALVSTGYNNTQHGGVFSFVGHEADGTARQWNMGTSNLNPYFFSIGYNSSGDNNPHYGVADDWNAEDRHHARLIIDRDGNTKIRGLLYVNGTRGGMSTGDEVIHAGNIGSQSVSYATSSGSTGGNAATATNVAYSGLTGTVPTWNQNTTGNAATATSATSATYAGRITNPTRFSVIVGGGSDKFYPIVIYTGAASTSNQYAEFVIERGGYEDPGFTGVGFSTFNARFTYKPNGWGYQAQYFNLEQLTQTTPCLGDYVDQYQSSQAIIWLRGATKYNIYSIVGTTSLVFENPDGTDYTMAYGTYSPIITPTAKASSGKYFEYSAGFGGNVWTNGTLSASNLSGTNTGDQTNISGNAATSSTFSTSWTNYKGVTDNAVAGQLMWKNYGNNHTIFDASNATSPTGSVVNSTNPDVAWTATYPTLMGWNGSNTYGVRVDSARFATSSDNSTTTDQKNFDSLFVNDAAVATEEFVTSQSYLTSVAYADIAGTVPTWNQNTSGNANTTSQVVFSNFAGNFPSGNGGGYSFGANHYSMGLDSGNGGWDGPHYRDLIIGYHTGVRIGAYYSGVRFYNNSPTTDANNDGNGDGGEALLMTIGGYVGTANHTDVVVENNLFAGVSMRAPIFYDSNDATYYLDPNSTSKSLKIAGNIDLIARSDGWAEGIRVRVPATSSWGGIRFTRDRENNDGNWAIGYTGQNASDDLTFWADNAGDGGSMKLQMDVAGNSTFQTSVRAPIFYDSADTSYYADFASSGTSISINGGIVSTAPNGAVLLQHSVSEANSWIFKENAANWGLFWFNAGGESGQDIGSYKTVGAELFGMNNAVTGFNPNSAWSGTDADTRAAWMLSNYSGYLWTQGTQYSETDMRAPIFYDSNDTDYYLDPNGTSNLAALTASTRARWNMPRTWYDRSVNSSNQDYWTGTNGWGTSEGNWDSVWKGGFSGWDIWGTNTSHPQGAGYVHAQGIVSGQHYASTSGSVGYGWVMVGAANATENRYWLRGKWDTTTSGWVEMITTGNIGSQSVASATSASYANSIYLNGVQKLYGGSDGTRNTGWAYHIDNGTGLHWPNNGWHIYPVNASDMFIRSGASDCSLKFTKSGESGSYVHCSAANEIGFLTTARTWSLRVDNSGNTTATGDVTAYSDIRLKENIKPITCALDKVLSLQGVYYNRIDIDDKSTKIGFIAQDVKHIVPEVVQITSDELSGVKDRHSVDYGKLVALLTEAIKEQQKQIDELKEIINGLAK